MNFQKLLKTMLIVFCISSSLPAFCVSVNPGTALSKGPGKESAKAIDPLVRLQQIKDLSKESLSRAEKKELRKEVKQIRKQLKDKKNGIYLSVGAIIIIILLLILLL